MKRSIHNLILGVFCLTMLGIGSVVAGTFGDFTYTVLGDNTIEITGYSASAVGDLIIPETIGGINVTSIGDFAFNTCSGLTAITIPNSITSIGDFAFLSCTGLTAITIPNSVTNIGNNPFFSCSGLTNIAVETSNAHFSDIDGVLLNKSQTALIKYPERRTGEYSVPNCITSIGNLAFDSCSGLTAITIPDSVGNIGDYAFAFCSSLSAIISNGDAPTLGLEVFKNSPLVTIYYRSSASGFGSTFGGIPTALIPEFTNMTFSTSNMVMNTLGTDGQVYVLQSCTNLTQGAWTSLETNTVSGGGVEFNLPTQGNGRFYRVVIEL